MGEYHIVILFYKFVHIPDPKSVALAHRLKASELGFSGRMLVADEGINATFEGTKEKIEEYKKFLHCEPLFSDVVIKESEGTGRAFNHLSVKVRDEVVTLGAKFNIEKETAPRLSAEELQKWYENNEDFVVLDLRNGYEIASGKFDKTIDPMLGNFRDLPNKISSLEELKSKKVVAVCTGGIRCEKATCLLKREGFSDIYQLKDGIHTYIQKYPGEHFKGTLFVFDNRMVTDVVKTKNKVVVGRCEECGTPTEDYCCDDSLRPSRKFLCCPACYTSQPPHIRQQNHVII